MSARVFHVLAFSSRTTPYTNSQAPETRMLAQLLEYCTSNTGLTWLILWSDLAIAVSYFAIPFVMLVVLRDRRSDIPYPWLWTLFVTFIVACGLTHVIHVVAALM